MKWISVKEKYPEKGWWVFVLAQWANEEREVRIAYFDKKENAFVLENGCCGEDNITESVMYWLEMELPPLPEGIKHEMA